MVKGRFSIAGLMGVVVIAALGFAALRNASEVWAGVMMMVASGVLLLAVVGVFSRTGKDRAWWLGFSLFGWAYLLWAASDYNDLTDLPAVPVPQFLDPALRANPGDAMWDRFLDPQRAEVWQVGRWLWCLVLASIGGGLARVLFGSASDRSLGQGVKTTTRIVSSRKLTIAALELTAFFAVASIVAETRAASAALVAGLVFLLTMGLIGAAVLAAVYARGSTRYAWVGFALFAGGYLTLAFAQAGDWRPSPDLPTSRLLNSLRPSEFRVLTRGYLSPAIAERNNQRIIDALAKTPVMEFPFETPLEDVLQYIRDATRSPDGWEIPIYIDPAGLQEAEKTMTSTVSISLKGVPLQTTLRLVLTQLGLDYRIKDGLLLVTSEHDEFEPTFMDPFLTVGQCFLALIVGGIGGVLAPVVHTQTARKVTKE